MVWKLFFSLYYFFCLCISFLQGQLKLAWREKTKLSLPSGRQKRYARWESMIFMTSQSLRFLVFLKKRPFLNILTSLWCRLNNRKVGLQIIFRLTFQVFAPVNLKNTKIDNLIQRIWSYWVSLACAQKSIAFQTSNKVSHISIILWLFWYLSSIISLKWTTGSSLEVTSDSAKLDGCLLSISFQGYLGIMSIVLLST